jgi:hypothetical protein
MTGRDEQFLAVFERIAVANEKLIELATEERSVGEAPGPPFCPTCGTFNPEIHSNGGGGPMADFILAAQCGNCGSVIYAVPESWKIFADADEARDALQGGGTE